MRSVLLATLLPLSACDPPQTGPTPDEQVTPSVEALESHLDALETKPWRAYAEVRSICDRIVTQSAAAFAGPRAVVGRDELWLQCVELGMDADADPPSERDLRLACARDATSVAALVGCWHPPHYSARDPNAKACFAAAKTALDVEACDEKEAR